MTVTTIVKRAALLFLLFLYVLGEPIRLCIEACVKFLLPVPSGKKPKEPERDGKQIIRTRQSHHAIPATFIPLVVSGWNRIARSALTLPHHLWLAATGSFSAFVSGSKRLLETTTSNLNRLKRNMRTGSAPQTKKERTGRSKQKSTVVYHIPFGLKHTRIITFLAFLSGSVFTMLFIFIPFVLFQWVRALPSPYLISSRSIDVTTKIFDRNGVLLYEIYADQNRTPVPLEEIPRYVKQATIAIEDKEFYTHRGFSVSGIVRAAREILLHDRIQGGSTITQQLVKTSLLTSEIRLSRKIKEVILAFWAEQIYTKNQILEMYLNQVPYGGTAWGIEAASQTYFGKSVRDVSLSEAAILAGLPAAPTKYSPFGTHKDLAIQRQHEVLRRMVEDGYITRATGEQAAAEPLRFLKPEIPIKAPHFVMYVKELLESRYGVRLIEKGGLRITTSLDINIQSSAEDIVVQNINALSRLNVGNGAVLITKPATGEILAMVGSKNYFDTENDGNVNVTTRLRQPGSSIKVVTYAAALENGFTAATILEDSPIVYSIPGSQPYAPRNYDNRFRGPVPLRYALGNSYNVPAVRVLEKIGVKTMLEKAKAMGISSWTNEQAYGLALTLGAAETSMLEMATVYGTLANNGVRVDPVPVLEITDYTGQIIFRARPKQGVQAVNPAAAWIISDILSDNIARAAAFGPKSLLVIPDRTVSVKTGTSNDKRDNWAIGFTPSFAVTVWVGNNDNSPMDPVLTSGITGATPIWHDIMLHLLKDKPDEKQPRPDTVVEVPCHFGRIEYFVAGTEPPEGRCGPLPTVSPVPTQ